MAGHLKRNRILVVALIATMLVATAAILLSPFYRIPVFQLPVVKVAIPKWTPMGAGWRHPGLCIVSLTTKNVREAIDIVREERARTRAERAAFEAFIEAVEEAEPGTPPTVANPRESVLSVSAPAEATTSQLTAAYEGTVMAVGHYEEEYGDTVAQSLAEEFGPEIASPLVTAKPLTPLLKQHLLLEAHESRQARAGFLSTLQNEARSLEAAHETLRPVDSLLDRATERIRSEASYDELFETYNRLVEAESECEALLNDRQVERTDGHTALETHRTKIPDLQNYLYQSLSTTYPVLTDTTTIIRRLRRTKQQLTRDLSTRF